MMKRVGRFYKAAIMQNLGIFIAIGILSALFSQEGWFPNEGIQTILRLAYQVVLPLLIANECGKLAGDEIGAVVSVIGLLGIVTEENASGILAAMIIGPIAGKVSKKLYMKIEEQIPSGLEMLFKNLYIGVFGVGVFFLTKICMVPVMSEIYQFLYRLLDYLTQHSMMSVLAIGVEPLKVLFFNNSLNHGILVPLGMEQIQQFGKSVLFLAETNPGPGLGILMAYWYQNQEKRKQYGFYAMIQFIGGIHEVYFPLVLARPALLIAVIAGSFCGMLVFDMTNAGLLGAASPGSFLIILMFAAKGDILKIILGVIVSAAVTFGMSVWVLKQKKAGTEKVEIEEINEKINEKIEMKKPKQICFVCDAGFGSSAVAASLLRKKLKKACIEGIEVQHASVDEIPEKTDLIFAQKNFEQYFVQRESNITYYFLESILEDSVFETLITEWKNQ